MMSWVFDYALVGGGAQSTWTKQQRYFMDWQTAASW
jgi:hypothetical protein